MTAYASSDRRVDLDWLRIAAFALLILYHVGMFYVTWDWHVKSPRLVPALEPLMQLTSPWRLTLLFLIAGAATRFMSARLGTGALTWNRLGRLLPPLLLGVFVVVPPQVYFEVLEQAPALLPPTLGEFYLRYVTASGGWCDADGCLVTPTYNHLWFVAYLLVYTLVLALLLAVLPVLKRCGPVVDRLARGWGVLIWPILFLALIRLTLAPRFEITHALVDDWYNHALSFGAFLFGFAAAGAREVWDRFARVRRTALALWLVGWAAWATYAAIYAHDAPPETLRVVMRVVYAVQQWGAIAALLGFARVLIVKDGPVRRYLTDAIFPYYIVHQTITVAAAFHLAKLGLPLGAEAAILVAVTFAGCAATYEIVRRVGWLRPWFGLKRAPAQPVA